MGRGRPPPTLSRRGNNKKRGLIVESWRRVFREGLEPVVSTPGLLALRQALLTDDPRLIQGATTTPPPLMCVQGHLCCDCVSS
jgi:hypothetical protein